MAEYEFSQEENAVFEALSGKMARIGILIIVLAVLRLLEGVGITRTEGLSLDAILGYLQGIVYAVMGVSIYRPSDNLKRIVTTSGKDIAELMGGIGELNMGFGVAAVLALVMTILIIVNIVRLFS